jgi:hypothetical protein
LKKKSSWRENLGAEILLGTAAAAAAAFYSHHSRHSRMERRRRRRSRGENQTRTSSSLTSWAVGVFSLEWYPAPSLLDRQHPESFSKTGLVPLTSTAPGGGKKRNTREGLQLALHFLLLLPSFLLLLLPKSF